ncbi:MAG: hypothetical protein KDC35_07150 [Acidobacteria bacterium]|nr:hypothetical protein [Acidobacteriota bacterium]
MRKPKWFIPMMLLSLVPAWVLADGPTRIQSSPPLKIVTTNRYEFFVFGIPPDRVRYISEQCDQFLSDIEKQWNVRLSEKPIPVAISVGTRHQPFTPYYDCPHWISSGYSSQQRKIVIQIADQALFEPELVIMNLKRESIRYLLRPNGRSLPHFLETGMAFLFSRSLNSRDGYRAVFAFAKTKDLKAIANDEVSTPKAQVLSFYFADWLWRTHKEPMQAFLHLYLKDKRADEALAEVDLVSLNYLLDTFDENERHAFGWTRIVLTTDALLVLVALIVIGFSVKKIRESMVWARTGPPVIIEAPNPEALEIQSALDALKRQPPRRRAPPRPVTKEEQIIEEDVDAFFEKHAATKEVAFADVDEVVVMDGGFSKPIVVPKEPPPKPPPREVAKAEPVRLPPQPAIRPPEPKFPAPQADKDPMDDTLDQHLDQLFGLDEDDV